MLPGNEKLLHDFVQFSALQLQSLDVDPLYPILSYLHQEMDTEQAIWHTLLYVGYYSIASATTAFSSCPKPAILPVQLQKLPTGIERRGFRDGSIGKHIRSLLSIRSQYGSLTSWLAHGFTADVNLNWHIVQNNIQLAWGNGRWAAYKTAEILYKVHAFSILPTDMGNAFSSGPRQGLALFYGPVVGNTKEAISTLDEQGERLLSYLAYAGISMGIEQLETMLCDFHAMVDGRYYVGHDIDQMQEQLIKSHLPKEHLSLLWQARKEKLPQAYLGEMNGWQGVDKTRKKHYQKTGEVVLRA